MTRSFSYWSTLNSARGCARRTSAWPVGRGRVATMTSSLRRRCAYGGKAALTSRLRFDWRTTSAARTTLIVCRLWQSAPSVYADDSTTPSAAAVWMLPSNPYMDIQTPLTTGAAARLAERSPETIRAWERRGWLSALRTSGGLRLFDASDVRRVAALRPARHQSRSSER